MTKETKQFLTATASMVGAIIGVGIFGVPYVIGQVGLLPGLAFFLVLGAIQVSQHLFFVEAAVACPQPHGLPGLVGIYLGRLPGRIGGAALVLGYWAALAAYVVVGGTFLQVIFGPLFGGGVLAYALVWWVFGSLVVKFGLKLVSEFEAIGTLALLVALAAIIGFSVPRVEVANLPLVTGLNWILPYGVILFSMAGLTALPEMKDLVGGRQSDYRRTAIAGTVVAGLLTLAFGLVVWGVSGTGVTEDAVTGLEAALGPAVAIPAAVAGFLAIATSFFATATNLKDTFAHDFRLKPTTAWLAAIAVPGLIYLLGGRDFLVIVGFSGAVFGGVIAVLVGLLFLQVKKRQLVKINPLPLPAWLAWVTIVIFALGALVEIGDYLVGLAG